MRPTLEPLLHSLVGELIDLTAIVADRKGDKPMFMVMWMGAGNKRIQTLQAVDKAQLHKLFQGPVDLKRRAESFVPQRVEQGIGARRSLSARQCIQHQCLVFCQIMHVGHALLSIVRCHPRQRMVDVITLRAGKLNLNSLTTDGIRLPMAEVCLTFSDLTLGYNGHPAVHHLNGVVRTGSLTAVVGANGSGKSTLMKGIVGVLKPMAGVCEIASGLRVAYLPQQSELDRSFPARVIDLVSLGLWPVRGLLGRYRPEDRKAVAEALSAVGLEGFESRSIDTLSGGQLQRALFARVLVQDADLILLDEPFNAIDARTLTDLIELIKRWHGENRTIMVVIHDLDLVRQHFPEALLLARRPVAWGEARKTLAPENLLRARQFNEAWDDNAPWCVPDEKHPHDHDHEHGASEHEGKHRGAA